MKLFQYSLALILFSNFLNAQCTPDTTVVGSSYYFAPANSQYVNINGTDYAILPYAETGVAYNEVLQFKIPVDTTVNTLTATIDYLKVLSITNLPASLQLTCNPTNCTFPGGTFGCVQIAGIGGQPDSLLLKVVVELQFSNGGSTFTAVDTIKDIVLVTLGMVGLNERASKLGLNSFPNPINDNLTVSFHAFDSHTELSIRSLDGKLVHTEIFTSSVGAFSKNINLSGVADGVYILSLKNGEVTTNSKISVLH